MRSSLKPRLSTKSYPIPIQGGEECPVCGVVMQRYTHSPAWTPYPGRGFFKYWDKCTSCKRYFKSPEVYVKGIGRNNE